MHECVSVEELRVPKVGFHLTKCLFKEYFNSMHQFRQDL